MAAGNDVAALARQQAEEWKNQANDEYRKKNYGAAIDLYGKSIEAVPTEPAYLTNRAAAHIMLQNFNEAYGDATMAVRLEPGNVKGLTRAGKAALGLGRAEEAQSLYSQVLQAQPDNTQVRMEVRKTGRTCSYTHT